MRVLVTGGAGFIGSHVVDKLLEAGHEPRILDLIPSAWHGSRDVEFRSCDLTDFDAVRKASMGCDAIAHLAAVADVNEVAADPDRAERINVRGTFNVLEAARAAGIQRFVYASTIWVYNGLTGEVDEETPLALPTHFYTSTKLAGEMYCRSYSETFSMDVRILRFGIPYGPRAREAAVLPTFVRKAAAGEPLTVAGGGLQSRRFVYVEDLAEGVASAVGSRMANRVYNLVGTEDTTIMDIAKLVRRLVRPVDIVDTEGRRADFAGAEVSGGLAARELGWRPRTSFDAGVRRYVAWLYEQEADVAQASGARGLGAAELSPVMQTPP